MAINHDQSEIEKLLKMAEQADLNRLRDKALHDPDPQKRQVYQALYTYGLDKRQQVDPHPNDTNINQ